MQALILSNSFKVQSLPLNHNDFTVWYLTITGMNGIGFYNSNGIAGASQPHKHMQVVPNDVVWHLRGKDAAYVSFIFCGYKRAYLNPLFHHSANRTGSFCETKNRAESVSTVASIPTTSKVYSLWLIAFGGTMTVNGFLFVVRRSTIKQRIYRIPEVHPTKFVFMCHAYFLLPSFVYSSILIMGWWCFRSVSPKASRS